MNNNLFFCWYFHNSVLYFSNKCTQQKVDVPSLPVPQSLTCLFRGRLCDQFLRNLEILKHEPLCTLTPTFYPLQSSILHQVGYSLPLSLLNTLLSMHKELPGYFNTSIIFTIQTRQCIYLVFFFEPVCFPSVLLL